MEFVTPEGIFKCDRSHSLKLVFYTRFPDGYTWRCRIVYNDDKKKSYFVMYIDLYARTLFLMHLIYCYTKFSQLILKVPKLVHPLIMLKKLDGTLKPPCRNTVKKSFYTGYLAKFIFLKRCRTSNLDPLSEFYKYTGILYNLTLVFEAGEEYVNSSYNSNS